jgi:hypothetical protein
MIERIDWRKEARELINSDAYEKPHVLFEKFLDLFKSLESQHASEIAELKEKSKAEAVAFFMSRLKDYGEYPTKKLTEEFYDKFKKEIDDKA